MAMINEDEIEPPSEFICALTMELMSDPVVSRYGHSYERAAILQWLARGNGTCPMTRQPMKLSDLITNHRLRSRIRRWQLEHSDEVTVFMNGDFGELGPQCFGFITVEADPDVTERPRDDDALIVEQNQRRGYQRPRRRSSLRGISRVISESRQRRNDHRPRRELSENAEERSVLGGILGVFQSRRAVAT